MFDEHTREVDYSDKSVTGKIIFCADLFHILIIFDCIKFKINGISL